MIVPAVILGIILGPLSAKFLDVERWGSAAPEQEFDVTLVDIFSFVARDRSKTFTRESVEW